MILTTELYKNPEQFQINYLSRKTDEFQSLILTPGTHYIRKRAIRIFI